MVKYGELCERLQSLILQTLIYRNRRSVVGRYAKLCNGHYVKFPFMYSAVAASEIPLGLEACISLTGFT